MIDGQEIRRVWVGGVLIVMPLRLHLTPPWYSLNDTPVFCLINGCCSRRRRGETALPAERRQPKTWPIEPTATTPVSSSGPAEPCPPPHPALTACARGASPITPGIKPEAIPPEPTPGTALEATLEPTPKASSIAP